MILEIVILAMVAWLAIYVVGFLGIAALRGRVSEFYVPSVDYADDFATKLSGSDESHVSSHHRPSDPDIVFAAAIPQQRRAGLVAAHTTTPTRKEATPTRMDSPSSVVTAHRGAATSHLFLVP